MRRRTFLERLMQGAVLAGAAAVPVGFNYLMAPTAKADPTRHLRPPGAPHDDRAFNAACIGCGLCGEVCPPRCIRFYRHQGGHKVNTPYIDPEQKACILCGLCMEVCPTDALVKTPRDEIRMGIAQIDRAACYPWVDKGVCGACAVVCPLGEKAIGFAFANMYRPVVKKGCVGCGQCVEVCPHPDKPIRIVDVALGTVVPQPAVPGGGAPPPAPAAGGGLLPY